MHGDARFEPLGPVDVLSPWGRRGLDPKNVRAYVNRGRAYSIKRDYRCAIADYTEAIRLDPNEPSAHTARAF